MNDTPQVPVKCIRYWRPITRRAYLEAQQDSAALTAAVELLALTDEQKTSRTMNYYEAMTIVKRKPNGVARANRPGLPGFGIIYRFGYPVVSFGHNRVIAYTPTLDDINAEDWRVTINGATVRSL